MGNCQFYPLVSRAFADSTSKMCQILNMLKISQNKCKNSARALSSMSGKFGDLNGLDLYLKDHRIHWGGWHPEMDVTISFPLFLSSRCHYQAEFKYC